MKIMFAAACSGLLVSLGLFWLMQLMLMSNQQAVKKTESLTMMDFIRLKRAEPEKPKLKPLEKIIEKVEKVQKVQNVHVAQKQKSKPEPKKLLPIVKPVVEKVAAVKPAISEMPKLDIPTEQKVSNAPVINQMPATAVKSTSSNAVKESGKNDDNQGAHGNAKNGGASSGVECYERPQPKYPMRALNRQIEGKVNMAFTVSPSGSVVEPVVVSAQPPEIFDDAALQAIRKWKCKPKIVDGKPALQRATQTMKFTLSKH